MKRFTMFLLAAAIVAFISFSVAQNQPARPAGSAPAARTAIRIAFGERQEREADYSGTISLSQGSVVELIPYRFYGPDQVNGTNGWRVNTRRANLENQP